MTFSKVQIEEMVQSVPSWFHSMDLGHGVITPGVGSQAEQEGKLESLQLPPLKGKSVLDINAMDGFFSFAAERRGAERVVALDHYMWAMDLRAHRKYWMECVERGKVPQPYHTMPYYKPKELPGKTAFDTAHKALGSKVEVIVADFVEMDLKEVATFDIVLFLGSLYHMEDPLRALKRVARVTRELAIIESEAVEFVGYESHAMCEFFETNELNGDVSNWWAPNEKALCGLCRAAGFKRVNVVAGAHGRAADIRSFVQDPEVIRYRAVVHAWK